MSAITHPKWGKNHANQTVVEIYGRDGNGYNITETETTTLPLGFGKPTTVESKEFVGWIKVLPDAMWDDVKNAHRQFAHRCGVLRLVLMNGYKGEPQIVVFYDGHFTTSYDVDDVSFRFAPEDLGVNDGKPIADLVFSWTGSREMPLESGSEWVPATVITFRDQVQMNQYLDIATSRRLPRSLRYGGKDYESQGDGRYVSEDGSILPMLVLLYVLMPSEGRENLLADHPDLKDGVADIDADDGGDGSDGIDTSSDTDRDTSVSGSE